MKTSTVNTYTQFIEDNKEDDLIQRSAQAWEKRKEQIQNSFKDFKIDNE